MFKILPLLLIIFASELYAQDTVFARKIIKTLASREYAGRGYCEKSDLKAANFIRNEFNSIGAQSLGMNYFQYFNLNVNTFPGKMEVNLKDQHLVPGVNFLVDPASPPVKGKFKVFRVRRQDLLLNKNLHQIIELSAGNAILIDMNDTIKFTKEGDAILQKIISALKYDPEIKNTLTIVFSDKKLTWSTSDWQAKKPVIILNSAGMNSETISEIDLNVEARFCRNYKTQNVIGIIPGSTVPDSFLILTSHYDHLGKMGKDVYFPGANDNASGVAMMLNICRYFIENRPNYTMIFIAFSAEEVGLLGSQYFVQNPLIPLDKIKFLINFDLAGTGDEGIKIVNASIFPKEFERLNQLNLTFKYLPSIQVRGEACISDHCMFYNKKVPCFYIYTLGGISSYHDIFDKEETLPLTEFDDYSLLMESFLLNF
jgi:hypothetical protein